MNARERNPRYKKKKKKRFENGRVDRHEIL